MICPCIYSFPFQELGLTRWSLLEVSQCKKFKLIQFWQLRTSICPALLGTLYPTEGLWALLTMRDREAKSSIALFSLFKSIARKRLRICVNPSRWRVGMRTGKGGEGKEMGEQKTPWHMFKKQLEEGRESSQDAGGFFTPCSLIFFSSSQYTTPKNLPPPSPEAGNRDECVHCPGQPSLAAFPWEAGRQAGTLFQKSLMCQEQVWDKSK